MSKGRLSFLNNAANLFNYILLGASALSLLPLSRRMAYERFENLVMSLSLLCSFAVGLLDGFHVGARSRHQEQPYVIDFGKALFTRHGAAPTSDGPHPLCG